MQISDAVRSAAYGTSGTYLVTHTIMELPWGTYASIAATVLSLLGICDWCTRKVKGWHTRRTIRLADEARKRTRRVVEKLDAKRDAADSP